MRLHVTPACCDQIRWTRAVVLSAEGPGRPVWVARVEFDADCACPPGVTRAHAWESMMSSLLARWCPHCGSPVPSVEPRPGVRSPIQRIEGGDYCTGCRSSRHCSCLPPEAAWQPAGGDGLDVDAMWEMSRRVEEDLG